MRLASSVAAVLLAVVQSAVTQGQTPAAARPNFVVILADDMGYSDLGCYGGEIATPHIDALSESGLRFQQFYNCSRCCPTRASLLTGYYPHRIGMQEFGKTMDLTVPTIAERLRKLGYRTAMSGKWHLSELPAEPQGDLRLRWMNHQQKLDIPFGDPASLPTRRGFERFYGVVWGVVNHFDPFSLCEDEKPVEDVPDDYYATDAIAKHATEYIREYSKGDAPFFIYTAFTAPHWPIQAPADVIDKYRNKYQGGWDELRKKRFERQVALGLFESSQPLAPVINDRAAWSRLSQKRRNYLAAKMAVHAAMIDRLDRGVGEIVEALRDAGELENTVILVMSDNGASPEIPAGPGYDRYSKTRDGKPALREAELQLPPNIKKLGSDESYVGIGPQWASAVNTPLRYWKMESYEGGCRAPLVVHWPAGLKTSKGQIVKDVGHVVDVAPTMLELAGVHEVPSLKMDGESLAPVFAGKSLPGDRLLYFSHIGGRGVRQGKWKASKLADRGWELFNLDTDPGETQDISGQHPEELNRLVRRMNRWRRTSSFTPITEDSKVVAAPAIPLVACDPYFSIWSAADKLSAVDTTHWTGKPHRLTSLVTIDGKPFRLMGTEPADVPALDQTSVAITPTQSKYRFAGDGIVLGLTFTTPALPFDVDQLSRPVTYVTFECTATDRNQHDVRLYFEARGEIAVNLPAQEISGAVDRRHGLIDLSIGSVEQNILGNSGDDLRIDWGYLHLASPVDETHTATQGNSKNLQQQFITQDKFTLPQHALAPQAAIDGASAIVFDLPEVGAKPVERWLVLAYDDQYSIEFMKKRLRPYWRRNGLDAKGLLAEAARDRTSLLKQCEQFDRELVDDLKQVGGDEYAAIATLAYRQCFAAGKFVADANGQPIQFSKENHSNGCIATSDVFYPMAPQFLLFGPSLAKSFVVPYMEYAASNRWKFSFAPHDLGTYPKANGQVYGGGETSDENQMPVEECGNLLLLMAAIARLDGNANFAQQYWPQLTQWAEYLKEEGFDPDNQLCTDDFAGHLAHNVNLSAKAICGLGAFAQLCEMRGDDKQASEYRGIAVEFANRWIAEADDGDHFRLAFDRPGTWSQKYNLVWDRLLGLNLFPDAVRQKEMDYYLRVQNRYGLPLDNRRDYSKLDWILWTATLTQNRDHFESLARPVYRFLSATPNRGPMTDWFDTRSAAKIGFTARPVVGGAFLQLLYNDGVWQKWAKRDQTKASNYAPMPRPPKVTIKLAAADIEPAEWRYTTEEPADNWFVPDFDDSDWRVGTSGFGRQGTPGAHLSTVWETPDIWLRRTFDWSSGTGDDLHLHIHHDEDAAVYINGVLAARLEGFTSAYQQLPIKAEAVKSLKATGNVLAVHCRQTTGGQYIDVGLATVEAIGE